eukprot:8151073-Alexandrium_andersonii.AAC.1
MTHDARSPPGKPLHACSGIIIGAHPHFTARLWHWQVPSQPGLAMVLPSGGHDPCGDSADSGRSLPLE